MSLINQFKQIPDFRHLRGHRHLLWMILLLTLLGFLCCYPGYRPLADLLRAVLCRRRRAPRRLRSPAF